MKNMPTLVHSMSAMHSLNHDCGLYPPYVVAWDEEKFKTAKQGKHEANRKVSPNPEGDSYLVPIIELAMSLPRDSGLMIGRWWKARTSAASTATGIRRGTIQGKFANFLIAHEDVVVVPYIFPDTLTVVM